MSFDFIKKYWNQQADLYGASHEASWGDAHMVALEIETIGSYIQPNSNVLDVGCANGYSAIQQLKNPNVSSVVGVDYSEHMIAAAEEAHADQSLGDDIKFRVADVRTLPFDDGSFDFVYTTRVLINLPSWEEQVVGIRECLRVVRPGGRVVFSEAFWEPLSLLNALRALKQLPPLVEHDFNRYLKQDKMNVLFEELELPCCVNDFSSIYYLGSRFLRELVTNPDDYPGYSNPINERFYALEQEFSGGGFGIQQAYVVDVPEP
jgi:ubiquinone/menaquinone biosynthesis C-methylase UbiE